ncbi:glycosyltransferase [Sulfurospirillum sp. 1612]|uniref:glycosyltransferase n=1 Tax=Sulfurospirillum sp. 1612 TaxID=3094835 RepID=UPI002F9442D3
MYEYIIVTHIPAFYKVNLYNELAKNLNILVVFIASNTAEKRADDFIVLNNAKFKYKVLFDGDFQARDVIENIQKLVKLLKQIEYKKLLVSGWDLKEFWYLIFTNPKVKNCLALESTINESRVGGIRGFIKKIFLSRISTVFASGKLHVELLKALKYKSEIKITKGVGIINKPNIDNIKKEYRKRFLFIGRLSVEKNIELLIDIFNELEQLTLTVVGVGPLEQKLKDKAKSNIIFEGQVENQKIKQYFEINDIFILPSMAEPWGLVVEEALYFGMPVIVSKNCGASELIKDKVNGYVVDLDYSNSLKSTILNIDDNIYQKLVHFVNELSVRKKDTEQVQIYL